MANNSKYKKNNNRIIKSLNEQEKAFISIILMNKKPLPITKFKRIFLERYTLWDLQGTNNKLEEMGVLIKKEADYPGEEPSYKISEEFARMLTMSNLPQSSALTEQTQLLSIPMACCQEYSLIWYLWQIDTLQDLNFFKSTKRKSARKASKKRVEEQFELEKEIAGFLKKLLKTLPTSKFMAKRRYRNWTDVIKSPYQFIKECFKLSIEMLRESSALGRDDVGKDNMDFLFEELQGLKIDSWYSHESFVQNAQTTLFSCNQPFRWIHFEKELVWNIINQKLRILGIIETSAGEGGKRLFRVTALGAYCLGTVTLKSLMKKMDLQNGKLMAHPNFEVTMVSSEINPKVLLTLSMFARPEKLDTMSVFRILKESVREGKRLGLTTDKMTSFLKENCKGEVPQNVDYSIKDWGS